MQAGPAHDADQRLPRLVNFAFGGTRLRRHSCHVWLKWRRAASVGRLACWLFERKSNPIHCTYFVKRVQWMGFFPYVCRAPDSRNFSESWNAQSLFFNRSDSQLASAVHPPSMASACPLMNPLSRSSARNAIAWAMSPGLAKRPMGTRAVMSASV